MASDTKTGDIVKDIKLDGKPNWQAVAEETFKLLSVDEPQPLTAEDRKNLVASLSLKSNVVVTMDTKLTYGKGLDMQLAEQRARRQLKKGEVFDEGWFVVSYFCYGWKGLKDADTGEELPFTQEAMRRAEINDVAQIIELARMVAEGRNPNA